MRSFVQPSFSPKKRTKAHLVTVKIGGSILFKIFLLIFKRRFSIFSEKKLTRDWNILSPQHPIAYLFLNLSVIRQHNRIR